MYFQTKPGTIWIPIGLEGTTWIPIGLEGRFGLEIHWAVPLT